MKEGNRYSYSFLAVFLAVTCSFPASTQRSPLQDSQLKKVKVEKREISGTCI